MQAAGVRAFIIWIAAKISEKGKKCSGTLAPNWFIVASAVTDSISFEGWVPNKSTTRCLLHQGEHV